MERTEPYYESMFEDLIEESYWMERWVKESGEFETLEQFKSRMGA